MKFSIESDTNKIIILHDECSISSELENIIEECDISPYDFYRILDKYGKRIEKTTLYEFDSYEVAGKAVDEIISYLIMNKLTK